MNGKNNERWIWLVILLMVAFIIATIILAVVAGGQENPKLNCDPDFFFNGWEIIQVWELPIPYLKVVVQNPDPKGKIQKVKVLLNVIERTVDAYGYFESGEVFYFEGDNDGKYPRKHTMACVKCHQKQISTPL